MGDAQKFLKVRDVPIHRVDGRVVRDLVPVVGRRTNGRLRFVEGADDDSLYPDVTQIRHLLNDTCQAITCTTSIVTCSIENRNYLAS